MAAATVKRPLPAAADQQRRTTQPFALFHLPTSVSPEQHSPTGSVGSTGAGFIHRDNRHDRNMDILSSMMPGTIRDSSPNGSQQHQQQNQNQQSNPNTGTYGRSARVPPPPQQFGEGELQDAVVVGPNGISPANSLRRMARETRGSSGSLNELGIDPTIGATATRERDRPASRERERRDRDREKTGLPTVDKTEPRRTPTNGQSNGSGPMRPSPYTFDSSATIKPSNHSSTDLLAAFGNPRDSPIFDQSGTLASLDPLNADGGGAGVGTGGGVAGVGGAGGPGQKRSNSGESLDLPNGEHGGWMSYDSADPSATSQRQDPRNSQANTNSRFSPDRFPLTEEPDGRDEEILSPTFLPRHQGQQPRPQPAQPAPQVTNQRRNLPNPGQTTQAMLPVHSREHSNSLTQPIVPVPKTQHAQVLQAHQYIRRPSSPLASAPVVQAQNTSSEESDSYTPRSPHANLPEIPSVSPSYASNSQQSGAQQYQSQASQPIQHMPSPQQSQPNGRPMPPPALVNRPRPTTNQPFYEQHRGMPAMQLPMYTGASMATALSSISPSQSVSAVGSPHPQQRLPPGPPFGPSSSVFLQENRGGVTSKHAQQLYSQLQQHGLGSRRQSNTGYSLDQQIANLNTQNLPALNANNLSALKALTAQDLRAMGFGGPQPPVPLRTPKVESRKMHPGGGANGTDSNGQRRVVETLDKAAGEVVELQDLQRAMEMNLDQWEGRDWQNQGQHHHHHHQQRPVHITGASAQYPSSHAVLPPGDRAKPKVSNDYEQQLQQLAAMGILNQNGTFNSGSPMHSRPGNPIPPTPFSATNPPNQQFPPNQGYSQNQGFPRVLANGDGWIPVPNTDGYPPSYGELISLYEQHNPGKQPSMRDVVLMQLAALASEPENVEGSVFSKSETPFPPAGFNPFIHQNQQNHIPDSARSSPRDPPGEFDKMLRRVGTFNQPPRRAVGSSIFGGDGETEVSRMAPSTATEGAGEDREDDEGTTTEEDRRSNETANNNNTAGSGLRLNFENSTTETLGATLPMGMQSTTNLNDAPSGINDLYPLLSNIMKSRAASVAPGAFGSHPQQPTLQQVPMVGVGSASGSVNSNQPWVEETDSDEELEAELDWADEANVRVHPRFIRDEAKRRRKWEIKFAELVKAFHELDRLTDTPMILLATPPRSSNELTAPPVSHIAISRSIKRDQGYSQQAHDARLAYHNILVSPPTSSRAESFQSMSPPSMSPNIWGGPRLGHQAGWSSGSAASLSDADAQMRVQIFQALGSLRLLNKVEEKREERRRLEQMRQKDERAAVERLLKNLLPGVANSTGGSTGNAPSVSAGSPAGGSVRAESVGDPGQEEATPQGTDAGH
ncbi:hypothetical protein FRC16_003978 [Serendipita sp. 398]|nr:hypothetical protein FRC16_003978 [Serendipita sp. 398]